MKKILYIILFFSSLQIFSQEDKFPPYSTVGFIIIYTSKNFELVKEYSVQAKENLGIEADKIPNDTSFYNQLFQCDCGNSHPYLPRGREYGKFLSIESTNNYEKMKKNLYVAIVANYEKGSTELIPTYEEIRKIYPKAYIKYERVYIGCLH